MQTSRVSPKVTRPSVTIEELGLEKILGRLDLSFTKEADRIMLRELHLQVGGQAKPLFDDWLESLSRAAPEVAQQMEPMRDWLFQHIVEITNHYAAGDNEGVLHEHATIAQRFYDAGLPLDSVLVIHQQMSRTLTGGIARSYEDPEAMRQTLEVYGRLAMSRLMVWATVYSRAYEARIRDLQARVRAVEGKAEAARDMPGGGDGFAERYWRAFDRVFGLTSARVLRAMILAGSDGEAGPEWFRVHQGLEKLLGRQARAVVALAEGLGPA